jgi:hypothetical protein
MRAIKKVVIIGTAKDDVPIVLKPIVPFLGQKRMPVDRDCLHLQ